MFTFDTLHEVVCNFDLIDTKLYDAFSVTFIPLQFILRLNLRHKWLVYVIYIKRQKSWFRRNHYNVLTYIPHSISKTFSMLDILCYLKETVLASKDMSSYLEYLIYVIMDRNIWFFITFIDLWCICWFIRIGPCYRILYMFFSRVSLLIQHSAKVWLVSAQIML